MLDSYEAAFKAVWHADTMQGLCALIASAPAPRLRESAPSAPAVLEDVIARCLAKSVDDRIASVADLAQALEPIAPAASRTSIERILRVGRKERVGAPRSGGPPRLPSGAEAAFARAAALPSMPPASAQTGGGAVAADAASHDARSGGSGRIGMVLGVGVAVLLVAGIVVNAGLLRRPPVASAPVAEPVAPAAVVASPSQPFLTTATTAAATATATVDAAVPGASAPVVANVPSPPPSGKRPRPPPVITLAPTPLGGVPGASAVSIAGQRPAATPPQASNRALTDRK